jgi:hypothetical protein
MDDGFSGGVAHDVRKGLVLGSLATVALVLLLRVLIRGDWVQRILALLLSVFPLLNVIGVVDIVYGFS